MTAWDVGGVVAYAVWGGVVASLIYATRPRRRVWRELRSEDVARALRGRR